VGAPVAILYSFGFLAFVTDLWVVEYEHGFRFLAAWHAVGLIDKEVILASGTALLILSIILSLFLGVLLSQFFAPCSEELKKCTFLPPNPTNPAAARAAEEKWVWSVLVAIFIGLLLLIPWSVSYSDGLLNNMPCVEMVRAIGAEARQTGSGNTAAREKVKNEKVAGVLLSNDSAYWYVLHDSKGRVLAIPLAEASEIQVLPRRRSDIVCP
jgi:hypothetical protein